MPADSYTGNLRFRLQATGGNINTWGALLNAAAIQLIEDSVSGLVQVTMATNNVTLSTANGATDQARMAMVELIGAPTAALSLFVPALSKIYLIINNCGQNITVTTATGTGIVVAPGSNQHLFCDGTNVNAVQASASGTVANSNALGGYAANLYPRLATNNVFTAAQSVDFVTIAYASTITLNALLSNKYFVQLAGACTMSITNPADGQEIELWVQQDTIGGRTLAWPGSVQFENGSSATLTGTAGAVDRFQLTYNAALNLFVARQGKQAGASGVVGLVISSNETGVSLFERSGSPGSAVTVNVTVAAGVFIRAPDTVTAAMDTAGFPSGSVINLTNLGYILGKGGQGGAGASSGTSGSGNLDLLSAAPGQPGGPALRAPGSGITLNLTNGSGFIWGGGGGGGGGGSATMGAGQDSNGGGGGGGIGGGSPGQGGVAASGSIHQGSAGTAGGSNPQSGVGSGGAGAGSAPAGGTGGAGGNWGSGGSAGANGSNSITGTGGTGGAGGNAVALNGGTINILSGGGGPQIKGLVS